MIRKTDIGVIEDQIFSFHAIKSRLHESAHLGCDTTGIKNGSLIHGGIVIGTEVISRTARLASLGMGERSLNHRGERNKFRIVTGRHSVARQFKFLPERRKAGAKSL